MHSQKLAVADEGKLIEYLQTFNEPERFLKFQEPELRRNEIKQALKDGHKIPGAALEETESVVIK
jgi:hypothetical protein